MESFLHRLVEYTWDTLLLHFRARLAQAGRAWPAQGWSQLRSYSLFGFQSSDAACARGVRSRWTFLDYGSGLGRALILASRR